MGTFHLPEKRKHYLNHYLGKLIEVEAVNADKDKAKLEYLGVQCLRPRVVSKLRQWSVFA